MTIPSPKSLRVLASVLLVAGCTANGGPSAGGGVTTGLVPVATVTLNGTSTSLAVGQTLQLSATTKDVGGNVLPGRVVAWSSSASTVASVSTAGLVTGLATGAVTISATSENVTAQTAVAVTAAAGPCTTATASVLAPGEVRTLSGADRSSLCVSGGTSGAEYAVIAINSDTSASAGTPTRAVSVSFTASNVASVTTALARASAAALQVPADGAWRFESELRNTARRTLGPRMAQLKMSGSRLRQSAIRNLAATPTVGTMVSINANGIGSSTDPCTAVSGDYHRVRIAAVSNNAIVAVDSGAPLNGFSDADLQDIAATFDTLVFATDTTAFGAPSDIDANGKVLLLLTQTVNQLTPRSSNTVIGGYFSPRDLFPVSYPSNPSVQCAASNEGEMFYLPVLDPAGVYNNAYTNRASLKARIVATVGHEFQHVINASRRLFFTNATDFEVVWLDEGLAHVAEELLYFRVSGVAPGSNITWATLTASSAAFTPFNTYQFDNMQRFSSYLSAPSSSSPYADNDSLPTRGATWGLLRYMMDQAGGSSTQYTRAMVGSDFNGFTELSSVFATTFPNALAATRQYAVSILTDGSSAPVDVRYAFPSWDLRTIEPQIANTPFAYPLPSPALGNGSAYTNLLVPGGTAYARFRIAGNGAGGVSFTSSGNAISSAITLVLVRTQ